MKIYEAEHKQYIRLGDLDHLLKCMRQEIYDKYDRDEDGKFYQKDGTFGLTREDSMEVSLLCHVMTRVLENKIHACETPEEIRNVHRRIWDEFYDGKYVLTMTGKDDGEKEKLYFFRKYCLGAMEARLKEEGKTDEEIAVETEDACGDPVFTDRKIQAMYFEDHESADSSATFIRHNYGLDVRVDPAWYYNPNAQERLKKWLDEEVEKHD